MDEYPASRRGFLKRSSLGMAGLALSGRSLRVFAADNSDPPQARSNANGPFAPVRYRPMAASVTGLNQNTISLDGMWRIDPNSEQNVRARPLNATSWGNFQVPGQWVQQGYDVPQDETAALAKEFTVPAQWAGYRIFLRFDAIHGGTQYWLNGQPLGYSENLFTPVEWEITDAVRVGQTNRLDLEMIVATTSERLSSSSGYTGYSLGGIDRAVRIYVLPKIHVSTLHLNAGLDKKYRDGELQIALGIDNPNQSEAHGFSVAVQLFNADGKPVEHSTPRVALAPLRTGLNPVNIESRVATPLKWNAEQPNLYKLILVLEKDGQALEQIERSVGFRSIEIRDRQLCVNGTRVKLAGVCHHEIDPLTGRADTMHHAEQDVKLFKSANLNFVRTSHYPCTQEFLDAADRYGLYVESEAPFCWVARTKDLTDLDTILTPTSAMIDYNHTHPGVILWSLANESWGSELFDESDKLCKRLDSTRPTTLDGVFGKEASTGINSLHYQEMPYDGIVKDDPRPFLHGECYFEVYHERTDVAINPGLRELWAAGSADQNSEWGKSCIENVAMVKGLLPGIYPGAWSYICASDHCIGSEIWSGVDDIAFLPGGKVVSSERGNAYWGLVDGWRRPKPELELAKFVFSPVWFPLRQLDYKPGQASVQVPVENRHSFTDLKQFAFLWELNGTRGKTGIGLPPALKGQLEIPIPGGTAEGTILHVHVMDGANEIVNAALSLGQRQPIPLPQPRAGAPKWNDDGRLVSVELGGFCLVFDRATGDFDTANPRHTAPIVTFPSLHVTRHDFGDLDTKKPPYAIFPDAKTRFVDSVTVVEASDGLELTVKDHYADFAGKVSWFMDRDGVGRIRLDYTYTGDNLDSREIGIRVLLPASCDEVKWRRWSEWGIFPQDSISRTEGTAKARRDKRWPNQPPNVKPKWSWSQDQTELGTAEFRSIKFCIYEASLAAPDGSGVRVNANADAHFRACLSGQGVMMYVLSQCLLAPAVLKSGARLAGDFKVHLAAKGYFSKEFSGE